MMENKQKWNTRKIFNVAISIFTACAIWVFVDNMDSSDGAERTKTISDIPIEYVGEDTTLADRGLMLLPGSDQTITLELRARRRVIARLDPEKIRIQANLMDITSTGVHNISYSIIYPRIPNAPAGYFSDNVTVSRADSYNIRVEVGELYSQEVEIRCAVQGNVAEGYIAGELQIEPKTLEIRGMEEAVNEVSYAKVTLQVDDAAETVTQMLDYELYDANNRLIADTSQLHATTEQIQVTLPVNVVKELPLRMNFLEAPGASIGNLDYSISPASVTVSGDAALLRDVDAIILDDFDLETFSVPITYNYAIPIPEGCVNLSGSTRATLTIRFRDMVTLSVLAGSFACENTPEGKTVTVLTSELPIILRGTAADVGAILPDNITVVADLTEVSAASGSYTVPASVRITTDGNVGVVGTYQVRVTISDQPAEEEPPPEDTVPEDTPPAEGDAP